MRKVGSRIQRLAAQAQVCEISKLQSEYDVICENITRYVNQ